MAERDTTSENREVHTDRLYLYAAQVHECRSEDLTVKDFEGRHDLYGWMLVCKVVFHLKDEQSDVGATFLVYQQSLLFSSDFLTDT